MEYYTNARGRFVKGKTHIHTGLLCLTILIEPYTANLFGFLGAAETALTVRVGHYGVVDCWIRASDGAVIAAKARAWLAAALRNADAGGRCR